MLSRDPSRSRPPSDRPLDVVGLELLLCVTQALLAGMLLTLTRELGGDARAAGLPVPGLLAVLGIAVGACWLWWLVGGSGWPLAAVDLAVALLTGALWLLSLQDASAPRIDPLMGLIAVSCAIYGIVAGVFLPGPRRQHWKGGISQPRRGLPETRATPARFSPPVQKVVDERLTNVSLSRVTVAVSAVRLPKRAGAATPKDALMAALTTPPSTGDDAGTPAPPSAQAPAADDAAEDTDSVAPEGAGAPTLVHRIGPDEEPLSVASMRLAAGASSAGDMEPDAHDGDRDDDDGGTMDAAGAQDDEDETVTYPVAGLAPAPPTDGDDPARA